MDNADRTCNLECVKKGPAVHEFVGNVKIILVDPLPEDYQRKTWGSALLAFVMLLIGVTVFTVFFFTLCFKLPFTMNIHIFLCTMGFQLFLPSGVLMVNPLFGGAALLKIPDRKCQHAFLQACTIGCGCTGTAIIILLGGVKLTPHSIAGLLSTLFLLCTSIIGPAVYFTNASKRYGRFNRCAHIFFAVPTILLSTICFVSGLIKPSFVKWVPTPHLHKILILFTIFNAVVLLIAINLKGKLKS